MKEKQGIFLYGSIILSGICLCVFSKTIAIILNEHLPLAATVSSAGIYFPDFKKGFSTQLAILSFFIILVGALNILLMRISDDKLSLFRVRNISSRQMSLLILMFVLTISFFLHLFWNYPPNFFPTNARMHWVDSLFGEPIKYFYFIPSLTHEIFYNYPQFLPGTFNVVNTIMIYIIGLYTLSSPQRAFLLAFAFIISGNMLFFSGVSEDVYIVTFFLFLTIVTFIRRLNVLFPISIFLLYLSRPQLSIFIFGSVIISDMLVLDKKRSWSSLKIVLNSILNRFSISSIIIFSILFIFWHGVLYYLNLNPLLSNKPGSNVFEVVGSFKTVNIDSFSISFFSGSYIYHFFWVFPIVYIALFFASPFILTKLKQNTAQLLLTAILAVIFGIIFQETQPMHYYNYRYLSYFYPFLIIIAFIVTDNLIIHYVKTKRLQFFIWLLMVLAAATIFINPFSSVRITKSKVLSQLFPIREKLQEASAGRKIFVSYKDPLEKNYVSYVLKLPESKILPVKNFRNDDSALLILDKVPNRPNRNDLHLILETRDLAIYSND